MCTGMSFGKGGPACAEGQEDGPVWWGGAGWGENVKARCVYGREGRRSRSIKVLGNPCGECGHRKPLEGSRRGFEVRFEIW